MTLKLKIGINFILILCIIASVHSEIVQSKILCVNNYTISPYGQNDKILTFFCAIQNKTTDYCSNVKKSIRGIKWLPELSTLKDVRIGAMLFHNCQISTMKLNIFGNFQYLRALNISFMELETLPKLFFKNALTLGKIDVSHNQLTEIPEFQFSDAPNLTEVDFSYNNISRVDERAFHGTNSTNIQYLNLSHNKLTNIELGTFVNQKKLYFLDLSFNFMKKIEFASLLPQTIRLLYIDVEHLTDLDEIMTSNLSNLHTLGITTKHNFNCNSKEISETYSRLYRININGVRCRYEMKSIFYLDSRTKWIIWGILNFIFLFILIFVGIKFLFRYNKNVGDVTTSVHYRNEAIKRAKKNELEAAFLDNDYHSDFI